MASIKSAVSDERLQSLQQHFTEDHPEALFAEVKVACDLTQDRDLVRCVEPSLLHFGAEPLLTYRIFEKWHGETWSDKVDL